MQDFFFKGGVLKLDACWYRAGTAYQRSRSVAEGGLLTLLPPSPKKKLLALNPAPALKKSLSGRGEE